MKLFQICLLIVAVAIPTLPVRADDTSVIKVPEFVQGQRAPSINVVDANGKQRRLADMRFEKRVLLTFFPKCFTGTCASQLTSLRDSYVELQKQDIEVWAISTDAAEGEKGQRAFAKELKLPFPLLPDVERTISMAYGAAHTKEQMAARMSVLVSKRGTIEWVDKQIDPYTHGTDVLARVEADDAKASKLDDEKFEKFGDEQRFLKSKNAARYFARRFCLIGSPHLAIGRLPLMRGVAASSASSSNLICGLGAKHPQPPQSRSPTLRAPLSTSC